MKDVEELLRAKKIQPQRGLSVNFTQVVIERIQDRPQNVGRFERCIRMLKMKWIQKPAMVVTAIVATVVISGTAFAAWPAISTMLSGETLLKSGNRIVHVTAENCNYTKSIARDKTNKDAYYEVKQDSRFTNEQVVAMIQGVCEEDAMNEAVNPRIEEQAEKYAGKRSVMGTRTMKVDAITDSSITLSPDPKYATHTPPVTYALSNDVTVFDYGQATQRTAIAVGDSVSVVKSDMRNISSETPHYSEDISKMSVGVIVRLQPLTGNPDDFYHNLGQEFVRVEQPKNGEGFRRVYEFNDH